MKRFQKDWAFEHAAAKANLAAAGIPRNKIEMTSSVGLFSLFGSDWGVVQATCPRCGVAIQVGGGDGGRIEYVVDHCYACSTQISRSLSVLEGLMRGALTHLELASYLRSDWLTELSAILESEGAASLVLGAEHLRERTQRALRGVVML